MPTGGVTSIQKLRPASIRIGGLKNSMVASGASCTHSGTITRASYNPHRFATRARVPDQTTTSAKGPSVCFGVGVIDLTRRRSIRDAWASIPVTSLSLAGWSMCRRAAAAHRFLGVIPARSRRDGNDPCRVTHAVARLRLDAIQMTHGVNTPHRNAAEQFQAPDTMVVEITPEYRHQRPQVPANRLVRQCVRPMRSRETRRCAYATSSSAAREPRNTHC